MPTTQKLTTAQLTALRFYAEGGDCLAKGAPRTNVAWALHCAGLLHVTVGIRGRHVVVVITEAGRAALAEAWF